MKTDNIFDAEYVPAATTTNVAKVEKSALKTFLASPVTETELKSYGTSKPKRIKIRAIIQHGKN